METYYKLLLCTLLALVLLQEGANGILRKVRGHIPANPTAFLIAPEMIKLWGYTCETHKTTTEDGYILTLHRIPYGRSGPPKEDEKRPAVLIGHGLFGSSELWLTRGRDENAFVFMLADMGYDVWLGNFRGSFYGRNHVSLSNFRTSKFWDFSFHQHGVYDTPALIDYILEKTGHSSLIFVGHSMSSTAQLVLLAERPEYKSRLKANFLLAPAAVFVEPKGAAKLVADNIALLFATPSVYSIVTDLPLFLTPFPYPCIERTSDNKTVVRELCLLLIDFTCGPHHTKNHTSIFGAIYHWPAGVNSGQLIHYGQQMLNLGKFAKFDWGPEKNKKIYGTRGAPEYNLTNIDSPIHFFCGENDYLAKKSDCEILAKKLPESAVKEIYTVPSPDFNHLDFLLAEDADELVYNNLISKFKEYL